MIRLYWKPALLGLGLLAIAGLALLLFKRINLEDFISTVGYPGLFLIVFAETGLLVGFFLPGDTLLITTGLLCERGQLRVADYDGIWFVIPVLIVAAILGDFVGYQIGRRAGPRLFVRGDSRFFKRDHLDRAKAFYDRRGGITIFVARYLAFIRTFAPTVAGAADMSYRRFAFYNITGGISWVFSMVLLGYFVGKAVENIDAYFTVLIAGMVGLSVAPAMVHFLRERRAAARRRRPI